MPSVLVNVEPVILDWVLQYAPNAKNDVILERLLKWRSGEKKPTFNQVETISKAIHIPLGYFFLKIPPSENFPVLQYRTIDSKSTGEISRDMIDTLNHMERVQDWMRDYMIEAGYDKLPYVGSVHFKQDVQTIVRHFRDVLQIPYDWHKQITSNIDAFKFFRKKLETIGILVMMSGIVGDNTHRSLNIEDFRAFTLVDEYAPLIFINANDSNGAKLFSLLHETAHIMFGFSNFYNDRYGNADGVPTIETLCNAVAAEVLIPDSLFQDEWRKHSAQDALDKLDVLSATFKCGVLVVARKAHDNRLLSKEQYKSIVNDTIMHFNHSREKSSGGDYYTTAATRIDNRFLVALDNSIKEGKTQYTDAFRLTHTNRKTFSNLMDKVRRVS